MRRQIEIGIPDGADWGLGIGRHKNPHGELKRQLRAG
jgi:hypothetical protein